MADLNFDISDLDRAANEAVGTKVAPKSTTAPIRANNPGALMPGGKLAQYKTPEEGLKAIDDNLAAYGNKGVSTLAGVISKWAPPNENDTQAYISHVAQVTGLDPNQSIDLSNPLVRHQISAGIVQHENGRKAIYAQDGQPSSFANVNVDDISKAVDEAMAGQKDQGKQETMAEKATRYLRQFGQQAAATADIAYGFVPAAAGTAAYAFSRLGQTPEQAERVQQAVQGQLEKPFGKAFGVTETAGYKGEPITNLMQFVGQNIDKGADWIAQQTGMPKSDAQQLINTALAAAPGLKATKTYETVSGAVKGAGQKTAETVGGAVGAAQQAVGREVGYATGAISKGLGMEPKPAAPKPAAAPETQVAPYAERKSAGAAAASDTSMIHAALQTATPEFQQLYGNMPLDKTNTPVVLRHLEADSLPVPVRLTEGQATGDLVKISNEQNIRGKNPELAYRFQQQNQALVDNLPAIREKIAPDVYETKAIDSSQAIINAYKKLDESRSQAITDAYKTLEDANGGQFPVDGVKLATNAENLLRKKLKTEFLPSGIKSQLDKFKNGEPMTFEQFEAMRTNLSAEIRKAERSGDGNAAMAAGLVRQALEELPMTGETANLKPLADNARKLAKSRFDALNKDPAYRAAINDTVQSKDFLQKFVINGADKNVRTMVDTLGVGSEGHQHMAAGTINWLSDKAGIVDGGGNFKQAEFNKALKKLDDANNLHQIFTPEGQTMLRTLGNVANYTQFQPRGSFVNNSNSLVGYLAEKGAKGLESAANVAGLKTIGYPLGSEARRLIRTARERKDIEAALAPGAGSMLSEIKDKGKKK